MDRRHHTRQRRWAPVLTLALIAPFIGEILLGDVALPMAAPMLVFFVPLYGAGALLVREFGRRLGGWPSILLLAGAYAVIEEGLVTQSLFDPNYAGLRLLDEAPLPILGMGASWTVYVLSLHVIWSMGCSIAMVECLFPSRAREPWLRTPGLVGWGLTFLAGCALFALTTRLTSDYRTTWAQVLFCLVTAVVLALLAVRAGRRGHPRSPAARTSAALSGGPVLVVWTAGVSLILCGIVATAVELGGWTSVVVTLAAGLAAVVAYLLSRGRVPEQARLTAQFGVACGAVLVYAAHAFMLRPIVGTATATMDTAGDVTMAVIAVLLLVAAGRRVSRHRAAGSLSPAGSSAVTQAPGVRNR